MSPSHPRRRPRAGAGRSGAVCWMAAEARGVAPRGLRGPAVIVAGGAVTRAWMAGDRRPTAPVRTAHTPEPRWETER